MLGIVFTSLVEMLEEQVSFEFADEVLQEANLTSHGAFTSVGYYPFEEIDKILTVLTHKTGKPLEQLLFEFGVYLFGCLARAHEQVLSRAHTLFDMLEHLDDDIHVQVKKLYPDADLPKFTVIERTDAYMRLGYYSTRELYALAEGLMHAAAVHFEQAINVVVEKKEKPYHFEFHISLK